MHKYFYKIALKKGQKIYKNYDSNFDTRDDFVRRALGEYRTLFDKLTRKHKSTQPSDLIVALTKEDELAKFISTYLFSTHYSDSEFGSKASSFMSLCAASLIDNSKVSMSQNLIERLIVAKFNKDVVTPLQENILRALPPQIVKELPQNIIIDADADGTITQINDKLVNKGRTLLEKANRMKRLIEQYNEVVAQVKADLKSPQEIIRISAILTSIIMETGIRPGRPGQKAVIKDSEVETFGVSTFTPKHINFVQDVAQLEFVGKRGKTNLAELKDAEVVALLQEYVDKAKGRSADQPQVFRDKHGTLYRYETLMWYMKNKLKGFTPSDFRRLKASREAYNQLKQEYKFLREQIQEDIDVTAEGAKEKVANLVASSINYSIKQARKALSHEPSSAAIYAYVTPSIVMQFINNNMKDTFEDSILQGESKLSFDVTNFIKTLKSTQPTETVESKPKLEEVQKKTETLIQKQVQEVAHKTEELLSTNEPPITETPQQPISIKNQIKQLQKDIPTLESLKLEQEARNKASLNGTNYLDEYLTLLQNRNNEAQPFAEEKPAPKPEPAKPKVMSPSLPEPSLDELNDAGYTLTSAEKREIQISSEVTALFGDTKVEKINQLKHKKLLEKWRSNGSPNLKAPPPVEDEEEMDLDELLR